MSLFNEGEMEMHSVALIYQKIPLKMCQGSVINYRGKLYSLVIKNRRNFYGEKWEGSRFIFDQKI